VKSQIKDLLERIDETYWGPEERAMIDQALGLAKELGDDKLEYQVRMRLTASAARTGDNDAMMSSFAWCLAKHDANPHKFPADVNNGAADLMWQYKWMVGALDSSPIFPTSAIEAMLDDMETHYRKAALGMSGVLMARFQHAWSSGNIDQAKELRTRVLAAGEDSHSHCDACGRSEMAGFALEVGEVEQALRLVDEIVEGGFSCGEEPEHALARTLLAKLRTGRLDDAKNAHVRSYRLARTNADNIEIVGLNMVFCAITGNEARGLAMVERHVSWLAHDALNEDGQFKMLLAIASVLEAVIRTGHGEQQVRGANTPTLARLFGERAQPWTVAELAPVVWQAAGKLAAAFDSRNGNSYISQKIEQARAVLDEHYDIPIHSDSFLAAPPPAIPEPQDAAGWLTQAENYASSGMPSEAVAAARRVREFDGDISQRLQASSIIISSLVEAENIESATQLLPQRIALLREDGQNLQADVEQRLGLGLFGLTTPEVSAQLEAEYESLAGLSGPTVADVQFCLAFSLSSDTENDHGERIIELLRSSVAGAGERPSLRQSALMFLSGYLMDQDPTAAQEPLEDLLAQALAPSRRAGALRMRARLHGILGDYDAAVRDADEATAINAALRFAGSTASSAALAGQLYLKGGRPEEALSRYRYALREAEQLEASTVGLKFDYGRALIAADYPMEAAEVFTEVLRIENENEAPAAARADTLEWLARAYENNEQYGFALGCYSDSVDLYLEAQDNGQAAVELINKGNLLRAFDETEDALEALNQAVALAEGLEDANALIVRGLEARGLAKAKAQDASGLEDMDRAIQICDGGGALWKAADLVDSKARALAQLSSYDEAVRTFLNAADGYLNAGDISGSSRAEFFAGQILIDEQSRHGDAIPLFSSALEKAQTAEESGEPAADMRKAIALRLGDALEETGQIAQAAQARRLADD
jgi:tetratricopeptide (TPR) repeat protein